MTNKTNEMWVECGECHHKWIAVYLPMELGKAARIMQHIRCLKCAEGSANIYLCEAPEAK